jgi:[ribosomal protein S5]-alanine N-acetyltransferase
MAQRGSVEGAQALTGAMAFSLSSEFPVLRSARLLLRELVPSDAGDLFAFVSDIEVQRYNAEPMKSVDEARTYIVERRRLFIEHQAIVWAMADAVSNRVIGSCGFGSLSSWHRSANLGYLLRRDHWGQGLAREAVQALLAFGFGRLELHRVEATTIADNERSVRVLEAAGFRREGLRRESSLEDDHRFHDTAIYGLLRSEYSERP